MRAVAILKGLGPIDVRSVQRDSLLRWMLAFPVLIALLIRWGLPPVATWLESRFQIAVRPYLILFGSLIVMVTPMLYGTVIGFLLLDQRDDRTLSALQVTPLSSHGYLTYRVGLPMILSVPMTILALRLSGLPAIGLGRELATAAAAAPLAPAFALFLAGFAANKVQGFALMKAAGVINWPPILAWFVVPPWQWAFGLCPTFWPAKLYWDLAAGSPAWIAALVGTVYLVALNLWLLRRFERVTRR